MGAIDIASSSIPPTFSRNNIPTLQPLSIEKHKYKKQRVFFICDSRLSSFQENSHQIFFIEKVLNLVFYKFDYLVLKFKIPLPKPKLNLLH